ncbi:MAG: class I SAM-dependent methyltransferase [Actinobacteria bacterium]|nr:MAG: class I SAM-dependent methyltransferase [Actinomycetota bacterium]
MSDQGPAEPTVSTAWAGGLDERARRVVRSHVDRSGAQGAGARVRYRYYYDDLYGFIRSQVAPGAAVLDLGCGDGTLLASLQPSVGVGVDLSEATLARAHARHPDLRFVCADIEQLPVSGTFDYVIASNVVGYVIDVLEFFRNLAHVVGPSTRVIVAYYNFAWEPFLRLAERTGLKSREPLQNWLSRLDLANLVELADLEPVTSGYRTPLPVGPAWLTAPLNTMLSALPLVRRLGIISYVTARPRGPNLAPRVPDPTCSVIVPARNEHGNIRGIVERLPRLGRHTDGRRDPTDDRRTPRSRSKALPSTRGREGRCRSQGVRDGLGGCVDDPRCRHDGRPGGASEVLVCLGRGERRVRQRQPARVSHGARRDASGQPCGEQAVRLDLQLDLGRACHRHPLRHQGIVGERLPAHRGEPPNVRGLRPVRGLRSVVRSGEP